MYKIHVLIQRGAAARFRADDTWDIGPTRSHPIIRRIYPGNQPERYYEIRVVIRLDRPLPRFIHYVIESFDGWPGSVKSNQLFPAPNFTTKPTGTRLVLAGVTIPFTTEVVFEPAQIFKAAKLHENSLLDGSQAWVRILGVYPDDLIPVKRELTGISSQEFPSPPSTLWS